MKKNISLEGIRSDEYKNSCCFCGTIFDGMENSIWPIYYKLDGEKNRCCNECNDKYVVTSRIDRSSIMKFREKFGISYYKLENK